ncbi:hypothetical protein BC941DRAFT_109580 [Chlamydoabsidia padenii]|nr:hypothetical protein BC941DRAFT_109580 [Chlamydoabsidia padenii]
MRPNNSATANHQDPSTAVCAIIYAKLAEQGDRLERMEGDISSIAQHTVANELSLTRSTGEVAAPLNLVKIPPMKQGRGQPQFKEVVIGLIRQHWRRNPREDGQEKTEEEIEGAYDSLTAWVEDIVEKIPPSSYVPDQEGNPTMSWKNLNKIMQKRMVSELTASANQIGVYLGQCSRDWIAKRLFSIRIKNAKRTRVNKGPQHDMDETASMTSLMEAA